MRCAFFADYSLEISDELYLIGSLLRDREGTPYFNVGVQWSANHADGERALKPLRTFGRSQNDTIGPVSYVKLQSMNDWTQPFGTKYYNKSGFFT